MGTRVTTLLLDTHVVHWWSAEPAKLSKEATRAVRDVDELAIADITWFELAWLAHHDRITLTTPLRSWLQRIAIHVRTIGVTPAIATAAVSLPESFPGDPADRLIYATAIENGWRLVTKDRKLRDHPQPRPLTLW